MADIATLQIKVDSTSAKDASRDLEKLGSSALSLEGMILKLTAAITALGVATQIKEITLLAARFDTMEVVMDRAGNNAGYTARQMRELESSLRDTGISMLESRNALTQLSTAHIDLSKAAGLARGAQDLAVVGNINSSEAFQRLVQGIKSGQTEILRTMGLNVQFEEGYKRLAKELGTTTQALSGQQKMNSRVAETMKELANYTGIYEDAMGTAGKQAKTLERYVENLQVKLGQVFQPVYAGMVTAMTNSLKGMTEWIDKNANRLEALGLTIEGTRKSVSDLWATLTKGESSIQWIEMLRGAIGGIGMTAAFVGDGFNAWKGIINDVVAHVLAGFSNLASMMQKFAEAMPGGSRDAKLLSSYVEMLDKGTKAALRQSDGARTAASSVAAWMKNYREVERIARGEKFNPDGPSRLDVLGKDQVTELPEAKVNKAAQSMIESLKEQIATFGMGKTAVEAYRASLLGLNGTEEKHVKNLLDQIDSLNWQQQRVDDARKAEEDLTEALERQAKARIELLYQQRQQLEEEGRRVQESVMTAEEKKISDIQRLDLLLRGNVIGLETYNRKLQEIERSGTSAFSTLLNAVDLFSQHGADAFTNFAMTGKFVWKDMINSIIADLIRLQSQKAFVQLGGYLLGMVGGATTQSVSFSSSSDYMNLPSGGGSSTAGSFSMPSAGKGGATGAIQITNIVNIQDGKVTSESKSSGGQQASDINREMEGMMNGWAVKNMRPGGLLNPVGA